MKSSTCVFFFVALICAGLATPVENQSLVRHRRQLGFFQNTGKLIQELIENLNKAAQQAKDAVAQFNEGLREQARQCRERFLQGLKDLQDRVQNSINQLQDKFTGSQTAIGECINSHRDDAQIVYKEASEQMSGCVDQRLQDGEDLLKKLSALGDNGQAIATQAFGEMRNCTEQHSENILAVGSCIGSVALQTEAKGASFLMQSGLAIGRLNLYMSTLPAALEVCAGSSLVNAGMGTARVLMDIGGCSASSVINTFTGNNLPSLPSPAVDTSSITDAASTAAGSISTPIGSATGAISSASSSASSALNAIQSSLPLPRFN